MVHLSISALHPSMHDAESISDKLLHEGSSEDYSIDGDNYPDDYIADNEDMDFPSPYDDVDMSKLSGIKRDKYDKDTLQTVLYFKPSDDGVARFIVYTQTRQPDGKIELVSNVGVYDSEEEDSADDDAAETDMPSKKLDGEHVSEKLKYVDNAAETDKLSNNLYDEDVSDKLKYIDNRGKDDLSDGDSHHAQSLVADGSEDSTEGVDKEDEQEESEYDATGEDDGSSEDDARLETLIIDEYGSADYFNDYGHGENEDYATDNDVVEKPGRSEHSEREQKDVPDSSHVVSEEAPDAYTEEVDKEDGMYEIVEEVVDDEGDDEMDDEDDAEGEYDNEGEHDDEGDSEDDSEDDSEEDDNEEDDEDGEGEYEEVEYEEGDDEEEDEDSSEESAASVEGHEINEHHDEDQDRGDMIFKGVLQWHEDGPDSVSETSDTGEQTFTWQEGMTDKSVDETVDFGVPHEDLDLSKVRSASQQRQDEYTLLNRKPDDNNIEQINVYTHSLHQSDEHATVVNNNNKMWKVDDKEEEEEKRPRAVMSTDSKEGTVVDGKKAVSEFFSSQLKLPCWHCVSLCHVVFCCTVTGFYLVFNLCLLRGC